MTVNWVTGVGHFGGSGSHNRVLDWKKSLRENLKIVEWTESWIGECIVLGRESWTGQSVLDWRERIGPG